MGLGGFGGAGPEGPPNVTEGAGQAPPPTGCLRPYSYIYIGMRGHIDGTSVAFSRQECKQWQG